MSEALAAWAERARQRVVPVASLDENEAGHRRGETMRIDGDIGDEQGTDASRRWLDAITLRFDALGTRP